MLKCGPRSASRQTLATHVSQERVRLRWARRRRLSIGKVQIDTEATSGSLLPGMTVTWRSGNGEARYVVQGVEGNYATLFIGQSGNTWRVPVGWWVEVSS